MIRIKFLNNYIEIAISKVTFLMVILDSWALGLLEKSAGAR